MRTLSEIIESAKEGTMPTHEECYWAMLTYESMLNIDHRQLREVLMTEKPIPESFRKIKAENSFNMYKNALNKPPKDWMGPNNDPSNPEYQKRRQISIKIFNKFANKEASQ